MLGHIGDPSIRKLLEINNKDVINIHGHVHESGGYFERFISGVSINISAITEYHNFRGSNTGIIELDQNFIHYKEL